MLPVLNDPQVREKYLIRNTYLSKEFGTTFLDRNGKPTPIRPKIRARTIDPGSSIILDLLDSSNTYDKKPAEYVFLSDPFGIIVTGDFLERNGFHRDSVKYLSYLLDHYIPLRILGVVKELPTRADIMTTDSFYIMRLFCYKDDSRFLKMFVETTDQKKISEFRILLDHEAKLKADTTVTDIKKGITILRFPRENPGVEDYFRNNLAEIYKIPAVKKYHFGKFVEIGIDSVNSQEAYSIGKKNFNFDLLAIEFSKLDKIKEFSSFIKARFNVTMNLETVKQRQNFLFSLNSSLGAIILVIVISAISILIYLSSSLKNHLDKVKRNLGNFLAFGANRFTIIEIYTYVVMKILIISLLIAFLFSFCIGEFFEHIILQKVLILDEHQQFFSLINNWLIIYVISIIIVALSKTIISVWFLVRITPGDLIYEREKKKSNFTVRKK
jgi:hypothetical protein